MYIIYVYIDLHTGNSEGSYVCMFVYMYACGGMACQTSFRSLHTTRPFAHTGHDSYDVQVYSLPLELSFNLLAVKK